MITTFAILLGVQSEVAGRITLPNGKPASQAVVSLSGSVKAKPLAHAVVDQRDRKFSPHISVVTVGTKVEFPNNDVISHNVFTEFNSTKFDFGIYPKGTTRSQKFTKPGLAVIMCSIHPDMGAYVMVVDTPYYAITDKSGHFSIPGVPPGQYKLEIWHESGAGKKTTIAIGAESQLDVTLSR